MEYFVIAIFLVGVIEFFISNWWSITYFKYGIPVYLRHFILDEQAKTDIDDEKLKEASKSSVLLFLSPPVFEKFDEGQWTFCQPYNRGMIHGKLVLEKDKPSGALIGYIQWWIILLIITTVSISIKQKDPSFPVYPLSALLLYYFLEKKMYDKFTDYLSK